MQNNKDHVFTHPLLLDGASAFRDIPPFKIFILLTRSVLQNFPTRREGEREEENGTTASQQGKHSDSIGIV